MLRGDDPGARRADPVARRGLRRRPRPARLAVRPRGARPAGGGRRARVPGRGATTPARAPGDVRGRGRPRRSRRRGPITEPLSLSFYQVDDYLTCPLKYKYAHVLRVPLAPHHAIVYGAALHKAVQLFHHRHARGHVMTEAELDEVFDVGLVERGLRQPRARGGAAGRRPRRAPPVPRGAARSPTRSSRPTSSASSASRSAATGSAAAGTGWTSCRSRPGERRRDRRRCRRRRRPVSADVVSPDARDARAASG